MDIETQKTFGCWSRTAWLTQPRADRVALIAHELEKNLRETWNYVKLKAQFNRKHPHAPAAPPTAPPTGAGWREAPWDAIRRRFIGPKPDRP